MDTSALADATPALSAAATGVVSVVGVVRGTGRMRSRLKADAEIAAALPPGPARDRLIAHVEAGVTRLIEDESEKSRDWPMFIVAVLVAPSLVALTAWLILRGEWWSYLAAVPVALLAVLFIYGVFETGQRAKRDARGHRTDE